MHVSLSIAVRVSWWRHDCQIWCSTGRLIVLQVTGQVRCERPVWHRVFGEHVALESCRMCSLISALRLSKERECDHLQNRSHLRVQSHRLTPSMWTD